MLTQRQDISTAIIHTNIKGEPTLDVGFLERGNPAFRRLDDSVVQNSTAGLKISRDKMAVNPHKSRLKQCSKSRTQLRYHIAIYRASNPIVIEDFRTSILDTEKTLSRVADARAHECSRYKAEGTVNQLLNFLD